jgi:mannose-6-phosphate isomerase-like protein (cupin superfamily)
MEVVHTDYVPEIQVEDRILQWITGPKGQISSGCCSSCIVKFRAGASARPPHSHRDCEEAIFLLSGDGEMLLENGRSEPVKAGDFLLMRKNEIHMIRNTGNEEMKVLCFYSAPTDNSKYDFHPLKSVEKNDKALFAGGVL